MRLFTEYLPYLANGIWLTVLLTVLGGLGAVAVSFVAGMARLSRNRIVRGVTRGYVEFFRGTSLLVQLFWFFFALPKLTGYRVDPMVIGVLVLALCHGAYGSEIVRGSITAVPRAQFEATTALNMSPWLRMRRVILPQAVPIMLPSFGNLLVELLKCTALVSLITLTDVTALAAELRNTHAGDSLMIFSATLLIYFVLGVLLARGVRLLERRANARIGKPQPPLFGKIRWLPRAPAVGGVRP